MANNSKFTSVRARMKLRRILEGTNARIEPAMQDVANSLRNEVAERVPVKSGNLKNLITAQVSKNGLTAEVGIRGKKARSKGFYAYFLEFGTKNAGGGQRMAPQPFLQPAWESEKPKIINKVSKVINKAIKEAQK